MGCQANTPYGSYTILDCDFRDFKPNYFDSISLGALEPCYGVTYVNINELLNAAKVKYTCKNNRFILNDFSKTVKLPAEGFSVIESYFEYTVPSISVPVSMKVNDKTLEKKFNCIVMGTEIFTLFSDWKDYLFIDKK